MSNNTPYLDGTGAFNETSVNAGIVKYGAFVTAIACGAGVLDTGGVYDGEGTAQDDNQTYTYSAGVIVP
jgi:hypothetical protein